MKPTTNLLLHPLMLISLLLLILNDWYLKTAFANDITGKLSDIAGLIAFTLFLFHFFPAGKKLVLLAVALFFTWWKSPLSSSFIFFLNDYLSLPVYRMVDYTDLWALAPLPLLLYCRPVTYTRTFFQQVAVYFVGIISFTAFTATSMIRHLTDDNRQEIEKYISVKKSEAEIIQALRNKGIEVQAGIPIYEKLWRQDYYLRPKDSTQAMFPLDSLYTGAYRKINYGSTYTIPRLAWDNDTLYNLQFLISEKNKRKQEIRLHSVEQRSDSGSAVIYHRHILSAKDKRRISRYFKTLVE